MDVGGDPFTRFAEGHGSGGVAGRQGQLKAAAFAGAEHEALDAQGNVLHTNQP